jgi:hypothetical protein
MKRRTSSRREAGDEEEDEMDVRSVVEKRQLDRSTEIALKQAVRAVIKESGEELDKTSDDEDDDSTPAAEQHEEVSVGPRSKLNLFFMLILLINIIVLPLILWIRWDNLKTKKV